jgi:membrane protein
VSCSTARQGKHRQRLTAILLTVAVAMFILLSFALVVAGPELAESIANRFGLGAVFEWSWKTLQWPVVFVLVATAIGLIYHFAPNVEQEFVLLTPGSVVATAFWLLGSLGFRIYVVNFGSYNETYGAIGGVMVLLLWLYISGLAVIIGAETNAEIEHASEHGQAAGDRQRGQRRTIGARAAREFREQQERVPGTTQSPTVPRSRPSPSAAFARTGVLLSGAIAALFGRRSRG